MILSSIFLLFERKINYNVYKKKGNRNCKRVKVVSFCRFNGESARNPVLKKRMKEGEKLIKSGRRGNL